MVDKYIPSKGDIVWLNFDPSSGKEIQKRRPALVVSRDKFNNHTGFTVLCPITSTIRRSPMRYQLPETIGTQGQVLMSIIFENVSKKVKHLRQTKVPIQRPSPSKKRWTVFSCRSKKVSNRILEGIQG